jgi:hypothetical protein
MYTYIVPDRFTIMFVFLYKLVQRTIRTFLLELLNTVSESMEFTQGCNIFNQGKHEILSCELNVLFMYRMF